MDDIPSVLVIDDDKTISEYLSTVIENIGYQASTASNGQEAFEYLKHHHKPDLILLDMIMPGMTGIEVLRKIKESPRLKEIIVIMVTGVHHIAEKELAFMLGASDYLEKPFETRELVARIKTHINLKKATEQCILQKKIQETILSTVPGIVYLKSKDGIYIHGNDQFSKLLGIPAEDIEGKTESDLFPEHTAAQRTRTDELILKLGIPEFEMQEEIETRDGGFRSFLTRKRPVFNDLNEVYALVGVSIDITEQVILKEAYYEKEELLTAILNSNPAEIWVINPDHEMILQNNYHLSVYGDLIGKKIDDMPVPDQTKSAWLNHLQEALGGRTRMEEVKKSDSEGAGFFLDIIGPVSTEEKILGAMGIRIDSANWKENKYVHYADSECITEKPTPGTMTRDR
ncbi:MAG: response regulator [Methanobacteriota archaeon]